MVLKCITCKLVFETTEQLTNHEQNFCQREFPTQEPTQKQAKNVAWDEVQMYLNGPQNGAPGGDALGQMPLSALRDAMTTIKDDSSKMKIQVQKNRAQTLDQEAGQDEKRRAELAASRAKVDEEIHRTLKEIKEQKETHVRKEFERSKIMVELENLDSDTISRLRTEKQNEVESLRQELREIQKQDDLLKESIRHNRDNLVTAEEQLRKKNILQHHGRPEDLIEDAADRYDGHPVPLKAVQEIVDLTRKRTKLEQELSNQSQTLNHLQAEYQKEAQHFQIPDPTASFQNDDVMNDFISQIEGTLGMDTEKIRGMRADYMQTLDVLKKIDIDYSIPKEDFDQNNLPGGQVLNNIHERIKDNPSMHPTFSNAIQQNWPNGMASSRVPVERPPPSSSRPGSEHPATGAGRPGSQRSDRSHRSATSSKRSALHMAGESAMRNNPHFTTSQPVHPISPEAASVKSANSRMPLKFKFAETVNAARPPSTNAGPTPPPQGNSGNATAAQRYLEQGGTDMNILRQLLNNSSENGGMQENVPYGNNNPGAPQNNVPPGNVPPYPGYNPMAPGINPMMHMGMNPMMGNPMMNPMLNPMFNPMMGNPMMNPMMQPMINPMGMMPMVPPVAPMMPGVTMQQQYAQQPQPHVPPPDPVPDNTPNKDPGPTRPRFSQNTSASDTNIDFSEFPKNDPDQELLHHLASQERETLRCLNHMPEESDLYQMKFEHAREMMKLRAEIEQTLQMKKLDLLKGERERLTMEREQQQRKADWLDKQKRSMLEKEVTRRLASRGALKEGVELEELRYDPNAGFHVYWDALTGVPSHFTSIRLSFGFYDGSTMIGPIKHTSIEHGKAGKDLKDHLEFSFIRSRKITNLPLTSHLRLVVEIQFVRPETDAKVVPLGWTCLEVFNSAPDLNEGKFECPVFIAPPQVAAGESVLRATERVGAPARLYVRIGFPEKHVQDTALKIDLSKMEGYICPYITWDEEEFPPSPTKGERSRSASPTRVSIGKGREDHEAESIDSSRRPTFSSAPNENSHVPNEAPHEAAPSVAPSRRTQQTSNPATPTQESFPQMSEDVEPDNETATRRSSTPVGTMNFYVHSVQELIPDIPELAGVAGSSPYVIDGQLLDKDGQPISEAFRSEPLYPQGLSPKQHSREQFNLMALEDHSRTYVRECTRVLICIYGLPQGSPLLVAWTYVTVEDLGLNTGEVIELSLDLFAGPVPDLSVDKPALKQLTTPHSGILTMKIWDPDSVTKVEADRAASPQPERPQTPQLESFIPHTLSQKNDEYFDKSFDGFDLYIDAVRFPPHTALTTRMVVKCPNSQWKLCFPPESKITDFTSPCRSVHKLNYHFEYRGGAIDPTAVLIIRLDCLDSVLVERGQAAPLPSKEQYPVAIEKAKTAPGGPTMRTYGFVMFNIFRKRDGDRSADNPEYPTNPAEQNYCLNIGNFQLPITMAPFNKNGKATQTSLDGLPTLIGSSLLLRIRSAPKDANNINLLSSTTTSPDEWEKWGLALSPPAYGQNGQEYDTSAIVPLSRSHQIFLEKWKTYLNNKQWNMEKSIGEEEDDEGGGIPKRNKKEEPTIKEIFIKTRRKAGHKQVDEDALRTDLLVQFGSVDIKDPAMYDFNRALVWDRQHGFNICIDCVHKLKKDLPITVIHCLNPPGGQYLNPKLVEDCHFTTTRLWDSQVKTPMFPHSWVRYTPSKSVPGMSLILDVRYIDLSQKKKSPVIPIGWTILPLFDKEGFFQSGSYQLPLIKGAVNTEFLTEARKTHDPWKLLETWLKDKARAKTFKVEQWTSIFVRACDVQRDTHFTKPMENINKKYLKSFDAKNYVYDPNEIPSLFSSKKELSQIVPSKVTTEDFEKQINVATAKETEITRYVF